MNRKWEFPASVVIVFLKKCCRYLILCAWKGNATEKVSLLVCKKICFNTPPDFYPVPPQQKLLASTLVTKNTLSKTPGLLWRHTWRRLMSGFFLRKSLNNPLPRPYFLGGGGIGGVPLDSHDPCLAWGNTNYCEVRWNYLLLRSRFVAPMAYSWWDEAILSKRGGNQFCMESERSYPSEN